MAGETDLQTLIRTMHPRLRPEKFVFASVPSGQRLPDVAAVMSFAEDEGTTLVVEAGAAAAAGLRPMFVARMITLQVHSDLAAVGFLAAVTARLAEAGIATNAVSAAFRDHLFVPDDRAGEALLLLQAMTADAARG